MTEILVIFFSVMMIPVINRIILLWPEDKSLITGWNLCPICQTRLSRSHGIPFLEMVQRQTLPCGHQPVSWFGWSYLLLTLSLVVTVALLHPFHWSVLVQGVGLVFLFYALAVIDLQHLIVEPRLIVAGLVLRFGALGLFQQELLTDMLVGMLVGAGLFTMIDLIYQTLRNRPGLGAGDAPMLGLIGAFVGWQGILPVVGFSAFVGVVVAFPVILFRKQQMDTPIPYVPFLAAAGVVIFFLETLAPGLWWRALAGLI